MTQTATPTVALPARMAWPCRRAICVISVLFGLALGLDASDVAAEIRQIADNSALRAALESDIEGDTLVLAPGQYGPISLSGDHGSTPAVIRSADPERPAEIIGLTAQRFDGLRLENLSLRYRYTGGDVHFLRPFDFRNCSNFHIVSSRLEGDEVRGTGGNADGFPNAMGLGITGCDGVRLEALSISRFLRGIVVRTTRDIAIVDSEIFAMRSDGINFAQVEDVLIEGNYIHSFARNPEMADHSDMIQFWTNGTTEPSRGITIRNNLLHSGDGLFTQSIFMRNDLVDRGLAGLSMYYQDVVIEENVIINAHRHGISIGETHNLTIRNNTVAQNRLSTGDRPNRPLWVPTIRVNSDARNVLVENNMVASIHGFEQQFDWQFRNNLPIQNQTSLAPGFYGRVFVGMPGGDPLDIDNFRIRPGGEADIPNMGASRLQ